MPRFTDMFPQYVNAADRKARTEEDVERLRSQGKKLAPIRIEGTKIAHTFWGQAWCENLAAYSDFETRLPRGRSYVRGGAVIHLEIAPGKIKALVSGSSLYEVGIEIDPIEADRLAALTQEVTGRIDSVVSLLAGKLSQPVMEMLSRKDLGMFPAPDEIAFSCTCPDGAWLCKHVAAVLYGVGARLDQEPELLFVLRGANAQDLVGEAIKGGALASKAPRSPKALPPEKLAGIFGIELDLSDEIPQPPKRSRKSKSASRARK